MASLADDVANQVAEIEALRTDVTAVEGRGKYFFLKIKTFPLNLQNLSLVQISTIPYNNQKFQKRILLY